MGITIEFALKFDAICMYICSDSRNDHIRLLWSQMGITIEFTLKFDAICMYICPNSRNYYIRLLQSQNRYHDWIPTEISYTTPNELTREYPEHNTQVCMSSQESIQSPILRSAWAQWTPSGVQYSGLCELNGHPPEFNIQLRYAHWTLLWNEWKYVDNNTNVATIFI